MHLALSYLLATLLYSSCAAAIPIPGLVSAITAPSPVPLVLGLSVPFLVLVLAKVAYMKYRRIESIHSEAHAEPEPKSSSTLIGLGLHPKLLRKGSQKLRLEVLSGYLVGMLGSPEWETRVKVRVDRAVRKARSQRSEPGSRAVSPSVCTRSRLGSSHRSRDTSTGGYRSSRQASSRYSSRSRTMSLSFLEMYSPDSNVASCSMIHPSSPPCSDGHPAIPPSSDSFRSKANSTFIQMNTIAPTLSPSLLQIIAPTIASWGDDTQQELSHSTGSAERSTSSSPTPPFETPPTTPIEPSTSMRTATSATSSINARDTSHSSGSASTPSPIIKNNTSLAVPFPTYGQRPLPPRPQHTHRKSESTPLSSTTRPLNIDNTNKSASKANVEYLSVDPAKYIAERHITARTKSQRRKSGSPSLGPSPLRYPVRSSSSSSISRALSEMDISQTSSSVANADTPKWELDDLLKNGQLDIDAVTEALGLGFSSNTGAGSTSSSRLQTLPTEVSESLLRKPGGLLCVIPEEGDMDDSGVENADVRPLSSLIERWGRVQHQKFGVETDDVRESVSSSILEVDLSLLGIDVSAISGIGTPLLRAELSSIWDEDELSSAWRDDSNSSDIIGFAC